MYIPKLRKIQQVVDIMKANDKNSCVSYGLIDRLIKTNKIGAVRFGLDWIVNLDEVYAFFYLHNKDKK